MTLDGLALGMSMDEVRALRGAPDREDFSLEKAATVWTYGHFPLWFREAEELIRIDGQRLERGGLSVGPGDSLEQAQAVLGATQPPGVSINWDRHGIRSFQLRELHPRESPPGPLEDAVNGLRSDQYHRKNPRGVYLLPNVQSLRTQRAGIGAPVLVGDGWRIGRLSIGLVVDNLRGDLQVEGRFEDEYLIEALSERCRE